MAATIPVEAPKPTWLQDHNYELAGTGIGALTGGLAGSTMCAKMVASSTVTGPYGLALAAPVCGVAAAGLFGLGGAGIGSVGRGVGSTITSVGNEYKQLKTEAEKAKTDIEGTLNNTIKYLRNTFEDEKEDAQSKAEGMTGRITQAANTASNSISQLTTTVLVLGGVYVLYKVLK